MTDSARWFRRGLVALVLLGGAAFVWSGLGCNPSPPSDTTQRGSDEARYNDRHLVPDPVELAPGLYSLGRTSPSAVYAVDTSEGLVLVDSGLDANATQVRDLLKKLHLDVGRLKAILITHIHGDHSGGAEHLRTLTGAKVCAGRGDCEPLRAGGPYDAFFGVYYMPRSVVLHPTTVDEELTDGKVLTFGEARFTALATPGHTPGSTCYLLERPGLRALFTGDVVMHLNPSRESFLGTYSAYLPPRYRGNARDFLASLQKLRALTPPDLVLPGHPVMDPVPRTPRISAERWHELLDKGIAEMKLLVSRYDTDGEGFLDGQAKELRSGLYYHGDCDGRAVYTANTPKGLLLWDAPGGAALLKRLGDRKPAAVLLTSTDKEATAGLPDLVKSSGCRVIVPRAGQETVRRLCPVGTAIGAAEDFVNEGWLEQLRALPLQGRGRTPMAYTFRWAGKDVLVSGRIPTLMNHDTKQELLDEIKAGEASVEQYAESLHRLGELQPALWLPAVPVEGQNANLYDEDWPRTLKEIRTALP